MTTRRLIAARPPYRVKLTWRSADVERVDEDLPSKTSRQEPPYPHHPPRSGGGGGGLPAAARLPAQGGALTSARDVTPTVSSLLTLASTLTAKQRQELLDQLALTSQMTRNASQDRDLDMWAAAVYEALVASDTGRVGEGYGQLLVKRLLSPSAVWRPVQEFMRHAKLNELTVVERRSVYGMLANLLVTHAQSISDYTGAPLGPKLVGSCTQNIAGVFEKAFPGYVRAGLAKIAAKQLVTRRP